MNTMRVVDLYLKTIKQILSLYLRRIKTQFPTLFSLLLPISLLPSMNNRQPLLSINNVDSSSIEHMDDKFSLRILQTYYPTQSFKQSIVQYNKQLQEPTNSSDDERAQ